MLRFNFHYYKKLTTNIVGGLALSTALLFMSPKNVDAQATIAGSVRSQDNVPTGNALIEFKQSSDTLNSYIDITNENGGYWINNVVTDVKDINNTNHSQVLADGTVATNMQSGNGRRTFYAAVGQTTQDAIAYNSIGKEVARIRSEYNPSTGITKASVDPSKWANGVYFLVFKGLENTGAVKFIQLSNNVYANNNVSGEQLLKAKRTADKKVLGKITTSDNYIVEITPTDSSNIPFRKYRNENVTVNYDEINELHFQVFRTNLFNNIDITTTIRSSMKPWNTLEGVTVKTYTTSNDSLINTGITNENGILVTENFPINESIMYKIGGKEGYFARNGMRLFIMANPKDSTKEFSLMLPPMKGVVPGTNDADSVDFDIDEIRELFRYFDMTASKSDGIRYYLEGGLDQSMFHIRLADGCALFGIDPSIFKQVSERIVFGIEEENAYIEGSDTTNRFGWNIESGGDQTNNRVFVMSNDDKASFGGNMKLSGVERAFYKELFGRLFGIHDIYSRESYMNETGSFPTNKDRAYYKLLNDFRIGRWTHGYDTKSMRNYIAQDLNSEP